MQQIADWLEQLGMSEYAERFSENKIDVSVLRHLTDQDLKDIGVALGHRRKILAAIAEFAAATATEPKFFEPEPKPQGTAERRQVTDFSDLVVRRRSQPAWTRKTCARSERRLGD